MDFREVLRHRKMVRTYLDLPVESAVVERILDSGRRAPSAGFSQGVDFVLFQGPDQVGGFWAAVSTKDGWPGQGVRSAPVIVVPLAAKDVYLDRYAEEDKGWTDRDESRWPVPYWIVDAAFASMLILLAAANEGLGALFFGLEQEGYDRFREAFEVPKGWGPIGVIAIGHPAPVDPAPSSRATRARRPFDEVVHRGGW